MGRLQEKQMECQAQPFEGDEDLSEQSSSSKEVYNSLEGFCYKPGEAAQVKYGVHSTSVATISHIATSLVYIIYPPCDCVMIRVLGAPRNV